MGDLPERVEKVLGDFVASARAALGDDLRAAVLFGSAAEGRLRATSDVNLMLVLRSFVPARVDPLRETLRLGKAAARLEVMWLLESEIDAALTAFAVKFGDILHRRRVLHGADPFVGKTIARPAAINRVRQVLLNLAMRMRDLYVERSLREEQMAFALADLAGPVRSAAATLAELEGHPASSPKEALEAACRDAGDPRFGDLPARLSEARETGKLPPGAAGPAFAALMELTARLRARAEALA